jgi:hypothetical protein
VICPDMEAKAWSHLTGKEYQYQHSLLFHKRVCHFMPGLDNLSCRKHFPWEDYDEWLYGESGKWGVNSTRRPDYIAIQVMFIHHYVSELSWANV